MVGIAELCEAVGDESVFGDCVAYYDPAVLKANCRADICARSADDAELITCNYIAAYARQCKRLGFEFEWMKGDISDMCAGN